MIEGQKLTEHPVALRPHPRFRQSAVERILVQGARTPGDSLHIRYVMTGALDRIRIAAPTAPLRQHELWRTTCFEAFMCADYVPGYHEANFSPSGAWNAYHFANYRTNMMPADVGGPPRITTTRDGNSFTMDVLLDPSWVSKVYTLRFGLSAVIEADDGTLSYWALAHPPGNPDFHHRDCFALELAATDPL